MRLNKKGWNLLSIKFWIKEQNNVKYFWNILYSYMYAYTWIQLISDIRDVKDILVRVQHKQFEFSTDLENLKTNQTGKTSFTIETTVNIYHCQQKKIFTLTKKKYIARKHLYHSEKYVSLLKKIFTPIQKRKLSFFNHLSSVRQLVSNKNDS